MSLFNKDKFNDASNASGFKEVPSGMYVLELEKLDLKGTKNGATQISAGWSLPPDDNVDCGGQWLFENQTMINTDGEQNDIGVSWLNRFLTRLSEGDWEPSQFHDNEEENLARFVGSKIKAKVRCKPSANPQYGPNYTVAITTVIHNEYNNGQKVQKKVINTPKEETTKPEVEEVGVQIGYEILFTHDGQEKTGLIHKINDDLAMCTVITKEGKEIAVHYADCINVIAESVPAGKYKTVVDEKEPVSNSEDIDLEMDMDEELDEPVELPLQKGANVEFDYKGKRIGKVDSVDEEEGKVRVIFEFNGKQTAGKVAIDKVTVVG